MIQPNHPTDCSGCPLCNPHGAQVLDSEFGDRSPLNAERPHEFVGQYGLGNKFCAFPVGLHQCLQPRDAAVHQVAPCAEIEPCAKHPRVEPQVVGEPQKLGCAAHGFKFREGCDACESAPPDQRVPPSPWCSPCRSYHPYPQTVEHWRELGCKADRRDFSVSDQHVAPPKLTVPISANNGVEVVVSGSLLVIRQPNFQQDAKVAVLTHAQAADIVKSLVAAHDLSSSAEIALQIYEALRANDDVNTWHKEGAIKTIESELAATPTETAPTVVLNEEQRSRFGATAWETAQLLANHYCSEDDGFMAETERLAKGIVALVDPLPSPPEERKS